MKPESTGDYHVNYLARHLDDKDLFDNKDRCWPEWYEYKLDNNNIPVYGVCILLSPKCPTLSSYIL